MEGIKMAEKMTALITGSYGGLGVCFVNIHAQKSGNLILVGRDQVKLNAQKEETEKKYQVTVHTIAADLSQAGFCCPGKRKGSECFFHSSNDARAASGLLLCNKGLCDKLV